MAERPAGNDLTAFIVRGSAVRQKKGDEMNEMNEKKRSAKAQRQYDKWKATMERRHGKSISEIMREKGRVGGKRGHAGKGYSAHPEMASEMGKRGAAKRWEKYQRDRAQG